ncbi:MAG: glycoside hydrolase family 92 protein [Planctomycetota bacterium]|nr:glycoside hydrolase family 92 protein [Planctomycetota bacterium]
MTLEDSGVRVELTSTDRVGLHRLTFLKSEQSSVLFKFNITARDNWPDNKYIQFASLDGKPLEKPWFYHRELVDGGTLELQLGPKPNRTCGSRAVEAPPSMSQPTDPG